MRAQRVGTMRASSRMVSLNDAYLESRCLDRISLLVSVEWNPQVSLMDEGPMRHSLLIRPFLREAHPSTSFNETVILYKAPTSANQSYENTADAGQQSAQRAVIGGSCCVLRWLRCCAWQCGHSDGIEHRLQRRRE